MKVQVHKLKKLSHRRGSIPVTLDVAEEIDIPADKYFATGLRSEFMNDADGSPSLLFDDDFCVTDLTVAHYIIAGTVEYGRSANGADPMRKATYLLVADHPFVVRRGFMECDSELYGTKECPRVEIVIDSEPVENDVVVED